jgi:hypothetical protein
MRWLSAGLCTGSERDQDRVNESRLETPKNVASRNMWRPFPLQVLAHGLHLHLKLDQTPVHKHRLAHARWHAVLVTFRHLSCTCLNQLGRDLGDRLWRRHSRCSQEEWRFTDVTPAPWGAGVSIPHGPHHRAVTQAGIGFGPVLLKHSVPATLDIPDRSRTVREHVR